MGSWWFLWLTGPLWGFVIDKNTVVYYGLMQLTGPLVLCGLQGHCGWQGLCDWQGLCIYCCWQGLCGWPLSVVSCCEQGLCGQNGLNRADIASVVNKKGPCGQLFTMLCPKGLYRLQWLTRPLWSTGPMLFTVVDETSVVNRTDVVYSGWWGLCGHQGLFCLHWLRGPSCGLGIKQ